LVINVYSVGYLLLEANFVPKWCAQIQESCTMEPKICRTSALKVPHSTLRTLKWFWKICGSMVYTSNTEWITQLSIISISLFQMWWFWKICGSVVYTSNRMDYSAVHDINIPVSDVVVKERNGLTEVVLENLRIRGLNK